MSDSAEKTEDPTHKKLEDSRNKGQVSSSKELSASIIFTLFSILMISVLPNMVEKLRTLYATILSSLSFASEASPTSLNDAISKSIEASFLTGSDILIFPMMTLLIVVCIAKFLEVGPVFSFEPMKLDFNKLAFKGFKNVFSMKHLVEFMMSITKTFFLSWLTWLILQYHISDIYLATQCSLSCSLILWGNIVAIFLIVFSIASIIIAIADHLIQKKLFLKNMKMSKDEVKQEYKQMNGNPEIVSERRRTHKEIIESPVESNAKRSTVLVTNPTHVAIGIQYELSDKELPRISLIATEQNALCARIIAKKHNIPIIENIALARALLATAQMNEYIPAEFIDPVVKILRWVYELDSVQTVGSDQYPT